MREAIGAAIPLAGVGCAIARRPLAELAARQEGKPFTGSSMTEDYEVGLRIGELGLKTMFVRIPARPGDRGVVASRGHFPASLGAAVRQKARWLGGIALAGWDRLGWSGGIGERWMRLRDRRGPFAALLLLAAYAAAFLWSQLWLAEALGAPIHARLDPMLITLLTVNGWLLAWRILMRAAFTRSAYGWREGLLSIPRHGRRQRHRHARRGTRGFAASRRRREEVGQDPPHLPGRASAMRPSLRFLALAVVGWAGFRAASLGIDPDRFLQHRTWRSEGSAADCADRVSASRGRRACRAQLCDDQRGAGRCCSGSRRGGPSRGRFGRSRHPVCARRDRRSRADASGNRTGLPAAGGTRCERGRRAARYPARERIAHARASFLRSASAARRMAAVAHRGHVAGGDQLHPDFPPRNVRRSSPTQSTASS